MKDIAGLLAKAAEKNGFRRESFNVDNIPTEASNITVALFFGDARSIFVLSSLLLHRYKEQDHPSDYLIVCSWPGMASLFPYVDEYWAIQSDVHIKKLYSEAHGFSNKSELAGQYHRNLNQYFFEEVLPLDVQVGEYYSNGLTDKFWEKYKQVIRFLPGLPSSSLLGKDFNREFAEKGGYKVFIYPTMEGWNWHNNQLRAIKFPKEFWSAMINRLLEEKFVPVICKNFDTYDLSAEFSKSCVYFSESDFGKILTVMRMTGCVLDIFNDTSRFALAARAPFVAMTERAKYVGLKEYELDDLCGSNIPKKYIFSYSTIIEGGNSASWNSDIFDLLVVKLSEFIPTIDRERLPHTNKSLDPVSYDLVRTIKTKRMGIRLLKIPKDD